MYTALIGIVGAALIGALGWIAQLGNRVTKVETKVEDLPTLINSQFLSVDRRLARIESSLNGHLQKD